MFHQDARYSGTLRKKTADSREHFGDSAADFNVRSHKVEHTREFVKKRTAIGIDLHRIGSI
jgi:hypothetical protein